MSEQLIINGKVRLSGSQLPLSNLKVELWDDDGNLGLLSTTTTNIEGDFIFHLSDPAATDIPAASATTLFKVFSNDELLLEDNTLGHSGSILIDISEDIYDAKITDNIPTDEKLNYINISGSITELSGAVLSGVTINIYENGFRDKTIVGFVESDGRGEFKTRVSTRDFGNSSTYALRSIRLEAVNDLDTIIAVSSDITEWADDIRVDLQAGLIEQPEEDYSDFISTKYDSIIEALAYVTDSADISTISDNDDVDLTNEIEYVAKMSAFDASDVEKVVYAHKLSSDISVTTAEEKALMYAILDKSIGYTEADGNPIYSYNEPTITSLVQEAIDGKVIPDYASDLPSFITAVKTAQVSHIKDGLIEEDIFSLNDVLLEVFDNQTDINDFVTDYNDSRDEEDINAFWADLDAPRKKAIALCTITGFQKDIAAALNTEVQSDDDIYALGNKDDTYWENLVNTVSTNTSTIAVPGAFKANYDLEDSVVVANLKTEYAQHLKSLAQSKYPLSKVNSELSGVNGSTVIADTNRRNDVITFLSTNHEFDFRTATADDVGDFDVTGVNDTDTLKEDLTTFQLLSNIATTKPEAVVQLAVDGFASANDVANISSEQFVADYSTYFGSDADASIAYGTAQVLATVSQNVVMSTIPFTNRPTIAILKPNTPTLTKSAVALTNPDLATMFGSQNYCSCMHCRSMYSPSAYYADILNFLYTNEIDAYTELVRRRYDLRFIELSCKNSNIEIPYIDLVNELLENQVLYKHPGTTGPPNAYQTNGASRELSAYPQHTYSQIVGNEKQYLEFTNYSYVYDNVLSTAVYPSILPFNLATEETRVYLEPLKMNRFDLMGLYKPYSTPDANGVSDAALYAEFFKTSLRNVEIITNTHINSASPWLFYGLSAANTTGNSDGSGVQNPTDSTGYIYGVWDTILVDRLDVLVNQAEISYIEILELLSTDYLNSNGDISIVINDPGNPNIPSDTCDLQYLKLEFAGSATASDFLGQLYRFVRLMRATNLSVYGLDTLLRLMAIDDIDSEAKFVLIGRVMSIAKNLDIEPNTLAMWWQSIDTHEYTDYNSSSFDAIPSIYDKIFKNKSTEPIPEFKYPTNFLDVEHQDTTALISSAARMPEKSVKEIANYFGLADTTDITLPYLSRVYVLSEISRRFKKNIPYILSLFHLCEIDNDLLIDTDLTSDDSLLVSLEKLITINKHIQDSDFSYSELQSLVQNIRTVDDVNKQDNEIQLFLEQLRGELQKFPLDDGSTGFTSYTTETNNRIENLIIQHFAKQFDVPLENASILVNDIDVNLDLGGTVKLLDALIEPAFIFPDDNYTLSIENLKILEDTTPRPAKLPLFVVTDLYNAYKTIANIFFVAKRLTLSKEEFEYIYTDNPVDIDLKGLPVQDQTSTQLDAIQNFESLFRFDSWVKVRNRLNLSGSEFILLLTAIDGTQSKVDLMDIIDRNNDWNSFLELLIGDSGTTSAAGLLKVAMSVLTPDSIDGAELLIKVADIIDICIDLKINPDTLYGVLKSDLTLSDAHKIMLAVKGNYNNNAWLDIAKPLRDRLRQKQRDALTAYILYNPEPYAADKKVWKNVNELYAHLLIDTEMEPCSMTSRLKQAICSVQLFVDRIILGLEYVNFSPTTPIEMKESSIKQWERWRKWYRIWEANRKVFLYPENWVEPELRDSKSVFFAELETDLLKDDLTDELAEESYRTYLSKLIDVARLEPVATFREYIGEEDESPYGSGLIDVRSGDYTYARPHKVHVMSRTYGAPHQYFYRRQENGEWTPWERVDLNIKGEHIMLYMYNNKLRVYWLTFQNKMENGENVGAPINDWLHNSKKHNAVSEIRQGKKITHVLEINVNWAEYKDGIWQNERYSTDSMTLKMNPEIDQKIETRVHGATVNGTPQSKRLQQMYDRVSNNGGIDSPGVLQRMLHMTGYIYRSSNHLYINLTMQQNAHEYANMFEVQSFVFRDSYSQPEVRRNNVTLLTYNTMNGTLALDNKYQMRSVHDRVFKYNGNEKGTYPIYMYNLQRITPFKDRSYWTPYSPKIFDSGAGNYKGLYKVTASSNIQNSGNNTSAAMSSSSGGYPRPRSSVNWVENNPLASDFIYEDDKNTFFGTNVTQQVVHGGQWGEPEQFPYLKISTFYHPQAKQFQRALNGNKGLDGLLNLTVQNLPDNIEFVPNYDPSTSMVAQPYPLGDVDFTYSGAYSIYNWELFFHTPMMIAQRLHNNQKFAEARRWYHFIFDPTSLWDINGAFTTSKQRVWQFLPFYNEAGTKLETITDLLNLINSRNTDAVEQVKQWENDPFNPHRIARLRILAYMKNVVMKYVDNLIAWGDQLFARDTIESINEATQLYILAENILGERPEELPSRAKTQAKSFDELKLILDALSNAKVGVEKFIKPHKGVYRYNQHYNEPLPPQTMFYFCTPNNDKLLRYWDNVEDRLFKIRNCMNLEGVTRSLSLYQPSIDPGLLVKAAAAGVDIGTVLNNISSGTPPYRFSYVVQKANEFCNDVKHFGSLLLSALEKKDAEEFAVLRSGHELSMQEKIKQLKEIQIQESKASIDALKKSKDTIKTRIDHYNSLEYKNSSEEEYLQLQHESIRLQNKQAQKQTLASVLALIPTFSGKFFASVGVSFGGGNLAGGAGALSAAAAANSAINNTKSGMAQAVAGWDRRQEEWDFQVKLAKKEDEQLDKQIIGAEIRLAIVEKELENFEFQIENTNEADEYLRSKYTNQELYSWTINQISSIYFQAYQLAYDVAKKAEKCFEYELPFAKIPSSGFIKFGYWDSLKKGLLAGEKLQHDIRKLELAHVEENKRELELTKHVSLAMIHPKALIDLIEDGECEFHVPEGLYDLDYPGHYYRRIKSVSISIPCIAGPYTTIACQLSLMQHGVRKETTTTDLALTSASGHTIATSGAQNDSGLFELNFNDQRYLPFEGMGAVSKWKLTLAKGNQYKMFDFDTIRDVILHIKYTAKSDDSFRTAVVSKVNGMLADYTTYNAQSSSPYDPNTVNTIEELSLPRYFSLKHEFPNAWHNYSQGDSFDITLDHKHFPQLCKGKDITINRILPTAVLKGTNSVSDYNLNDSGNSISNLTFGSIDFVATTPTILEPDNSMSFSFNIKKSAAEVILDTEFEDVFIVMYYDLTT